MTDATEIRTPPTYRALKHVLGDPFSFRVMTLLTGAVSLYLGMRLSAAANLLVSFVGVFLIVTGAQIVLWSLGIRLELIGTDVDTDLGGHRSGRTTLVETGLQHAAETIDLAEQTFGGGKLRVATAAHVNYVSHELLEALYTADVRATTILLTNEMERVARGVQVPAWVRDPKASSPVGDATYRNNTWLAYRAFWSFRNDVMSGRVRLEADDGYKVVDMGIRIIRLLAISIQNEKEFFATPHHFTIDYSNASNDPLLTPPDAELENEPEEPEEIG
jgi:hypothetical protein